jgi:hypothetical protein
MRGTAWRPEGRQRTPEVRDNKNRRKGIAEVAKYTVKDTEDGDLVHVGDGTIRNDITTIVE